MAVVACYTPITKFDAGPMHYLTANVYVYRIMVLTFVTCFLNHFFSFAESVLNTYFI